MTGNPAIASKIPSKSDCWTGSSLSRATRRAASSRAMIISCTIGSRSWAMNMCSVRQRPIPSAPNSRALAASSGVSAFARTRSRRSSSAQSRIVPKFSSIAGRDEPHGADDHAAGAAVDRDHVTDLQRVLADRHGAGPFVDREPLAAGHARLAHAARDDRRVRRHPSVRGQHAARLDEAVDVVRRRLPAHEDDVVARLAAALGRVGVEHDLAGRGSGRRVQPLRGHLDVRGRVDHRVQELVELARGRCGRPPPRGRSAPPRPSRPRSGAPRSPCACRCGSAAGRAVPSSTVNSMSCMSR